MTETGTRIDEKNSFRGGKNISVPEITMDQRRFFYGAEGCNNLMKTRPLFLLFFCEISGTTCLFELRLQAMIPIEVCPVVPVRDRKSGVQGRGVGQSGGRSG